MFGRDSRQSPHHSIRWVGWALALAGLAEGVMLAGPQASAQPQVKAAKEDKASEIDDRSPLPPGERSLLGERIRVPNPDRAIFAGRKDSNGNRLLGTGVVDFEEIASEKKNADEYQAWHEVILHAKSISAKDLEEFARKDLTRDDLLGYGPLPFAYRLSLLKFEGLVTRVRRIPATKSLQEAGTKEVYEALLVAHDDPPTETISVVFTDLPPGLASVAQASEAQWVDVNAEAVAAGYFFKVKKEPHTTEQTPVLIGKSLLMAGNANEANSAKLASRIAIDTGLQVFKGIRDDARAVRNDDTSWQEAVSENRVLLHARRFTPEELEANARTDVTFADLFEPIRKDYKLQLIRFEGRLLLVRKMEPSQKLRGAGLEAAYEGWLVPKDEPRGNPVCIVFTELPEGISELGRVNRWVSFAGYSFKLLRYESGEQEEKDKTKNVVKRAPMLIGRAAILRPDPDAPSKVSWESFVETALVVFVGLLGIAGAITLWYRLGDTRARQEITAHRGKNPFETG